MAEHSKGVRFDLGERKSLLPIRIRKLPIEVDAWPVRELNRAAERDWQALPKCIRDDYENPQGEGAWVFGALVASRNPECEKAWPECESGKYDPRCCRFPKSCSCEVERRGIYVPTLEGSLFAAPDDYIVQGIQGEFYPIKPLILAATYEVISG